jgi:myosin-crossreactive antigen
MSTSQEPLIRVGQAITRYYKQLNSKELTEQDFSQWIESLQEPMKGAFSKKGLEECRGVLPFQRFILELQDKGLDEYLKGELSKEDYAYYLEQS